MAKGSLIHSCLKVIFSPEFLPHLQPSIEAVLQLKTVGYHFNVLLSRSHVSIETTIQPQQAQVCCDQQSVRTAVHDCAAHIPAYVCLHETCLICFNWRFLYNNACIASI